MSKVYAADLASCIWKLLGFVLRLIHTVTDYAKYYIAGHWKTGPIEGASSMRGHPLPSPHTHTEELEHWGGWVPRPSGPDAYERLKTPHRLVRSQYCGIVWVKEEESWRDLEICATPKVGGGRRLPSAPPLPGKWGGERPPCPPPLFLRLCKRPRPVVEGGGLAMESDASPLALPCRD